MFFFVWENFLSMWNANEYMHVPGARGTKFLKNTWGQFFHLRSHRHPPLQNTQCGYFGPKMAILRKHWKISPHLCQLSNNFHELNSSNYSNWWLDAFIFIIQEFVS